MYGGRLPSGFGMGQATLLKLFLLVSLSGSLPAQVTGNVLQRVFEITSVGQGTAFTIDVDGRQYLVTAAHLLPKEGDHFGVKISQNGAWQDLAVQVVRCPGEIDVAVLIPPAKLSVTFPLDPTSDQLQVGQDVFFLGFPYGLSMSFAMSSGHPFALVKKGILSGFLGRKGIDGFLLDGMNVKGFSGGPIVFRPGLSSTNFRVAGVIGGYISERLPIFQKGTKKGQDTETDTFVNANTGLAYGFDIRFALDAIKQKPMGPSILP
jgi:hypothetical protein